MRFPFVVLSLVMALPARADVRVVGSDLLGVEFSRALYEFGGRHGLTLALAFDGSRPGLDQLEAGRADLALVALPAEEEPAIAGAASLTLAYHALVVVVPAELPIEQLTLAELGGVFGESERGSLARWGDHGLGAEWASDAIALAAPAPAMGMMVDFFCRSVLRGRALKSTVMRFADESELARQLAEDRRTVALASIPAKGMPASKIVPIALRAGEPAFTPTPENLHAGDYPLRLPLHVVFRLESAVKVRPLLRFLFSEKLASTLERVGVVPLPSAARRQQRLALEKL